MADYQSSGQPVFQQHRGMAPPQNRMNMPGMAPPNPGPPMPGAQFPQKPAFPGQQYGPPPPRGMAAGPPNPRFAGPPSSVGPPPPLMNNMGPQAGPYGPPPGMNSSQNLMNSGLAAPVSGANVRPNPAPSMAPPQGDQLGLNKGGSYQNMLSSNLPVDGTGQPHVNGVQTSQSNVASPLLPQGVPPRPGHPQVNGPPVPSFNKAGPPGTNFSAPAPRTVGPPLPGQQYTRPGLGPPPMGQTQPMGVAPPPPRPGFPPSSQPPVSGTGQFRQPLSNQAPGQMSPPQMQGQRPPLQGLPLPGQGIPPSFQGQGQMQTAPMSQASDSPSVSAKSSRVPSPVPGMHFDAMEGQFTHSQPGLPPMPSQPEAPSSQPAEMNQRPGGIAAGRRQYPQMATQIGYSQASPMPPATGMPAHPGMAPSTAGMPPAPGMMPPGGGMMNNVMPPASAGMPNHHGHHHDGMGGINNTFSNMKLQHQYGGGDMRSVNLLQERVLIPADGVEDTKPNLQHDWKKANCSPDIFRCTLTSMPQTQSLLNKSRLPLGILIHPFKDLSQLPVIQSSVIVRCRSCRTYINPFVSFVDMRRWKCNLCYRVNELPEEFNFDPVSKSYGEPQRRPEIRSSTIEFIAPSEYMLRPPQPAVYLYMLDVSFNATETGYLSLVCQTILDELERIPGDSRTQIGFMSFDSSLHFYNLDPTLSQPQLMVVSDVEDIFLPCPEGLLVNLQESKSLIVDLLSQLPNMFEKNMDTGNALGPALQAALKLMTSTGGRVTVFQTHLPSVGPGALKCREDPNERASKNISHLGPATDFYKKLALDCAAQQVAVDLFMLNGQYSDIASVACISKYSSGSLHYYPQYHSIRNPAESERLENDLRRYLTRKIGFEAVMRVRCTKGLSIHTFHGNFFVRSTDLLSLPNINPDAAFGMQMSIEDTLNESSTACFQAALLYTSSKGERRIRVHTLCVPVTTQLSDVFAGADQKAVVGLLAKMAADRSVTSSVSDARDAMNYAAVDMLSAYGASLSAAQKMGMLPCPYTLRMMPLYVTALLKYIGFRMGTSTRLDDRVFALEQCKTMPLCYLLQHIYPDLFPVHALDDRNALSQGDTDICQPPRLHLSSANIDRHGVYLMDAGSQMYLYVGAAVSDRLCQEMLDLPNFSSIPDGLSELPELENPTSERLRTFVSHLQEQRPFYSPLLVVREDSRNKMQFIRHLVDDRTESTMSYYEYLQHLQKEVKS